MGGSSTDVDVVVIGGGVNGTGVARDCSLRGLSVALFEKNDIGFGASGNSSGMIHGGPRYLTKDPEVTYSSCLDSGHIQRIAPHMLFRVPFLVPVFARGPQAFAELAVYDAFFEVYDRYQHLKRGKPHLRFSGDQVSELEPSLARTSGAVSFDEWGIDGVRLCVASLKDAEEHGARVFDHHAVTRVERASDGPVSGVEAVDTETGEKTFVSAKVVVNATGAWAPLTGALGKLPRDSTRLRPGKGIHVFLDKRLSNFAIITKAVDGRQVFLLPWQNMSVLGTTDTDYYGDLDDVRATTEEVRYLREAIARVVPAVRTARATGTSAGVRPTLYAWGPHPDALTRDHRIVDHKEDGVPGVYSMIGGKLASYRLFAEEMSDIISKRLKVNKACQTHSLPLPGGEEPAGPEQARAMVGEFGIDELTARRLCFRHGARAVRVLREAPEEQHRLVCPCEPVTEAEIRSVVKNEWVRDVGDVSRRTRLGLGACGGMRCATRCGQLVAEERGLKPSEGLRLAADFLNGALRNRLPAMGPEQARQEALSAAHVYAQTGIAAEGKLLRELGSQGRKKGSPA